MSYRDDRGGGRDRDGGRDDRGGGGYGGGGGGGGGFRRPPSNVDRMTSLRVGNLPFRLVYIYFISDVLLANDLY